MKRPTPREIAFMVAELPGVVVPFLSFAGRAPDTPVRALLSWHENPWVVLLLLLLAFLAVPVLILASTVRQALAGPPTRGEIWMAYGVAFAALAGISLFLPDEPQPVHPSVIGSCWIVAVGAIAVLASTMNSRVGCDMALMISARASYFALTFGSIIPPRCPLFSYFTK